MLSAPGRVDVWKTDNVQRLDPIAEGHPERRFTEATVMRLCRCRLSPEEAAAYVTRYDAALASAHPAEESGRVLFPFRRLVFTLTVCNHADAVSD